MPTTLLGLTYVENSQSGKFAVINTDLDLLDAALGACYGYAAQTANYTVLKTDRVIAVTPAASMTVTLPATTGASAPRANQPFLIADVSGALISSGRTITIAVPSGKKLDGVTNGTSVIYGDLGHVEVIFVSDSTGYITVRSRGLLDIKDDFANITDFMRSPTSHVTNNITLPTASNHTPGYIPFIPKFDMGIDQVIFGFGSVGPSSDATNASVRYAFYDADSSTRLPSALLWASEDALLQGAGHLRVTTATHLFDIGSLAVSSASLTLSARRLFKRNRLYYLAYHLQPTFSAGTASEITRVSMGPQVQKLSAGAQAWPYTFAATPTVGVQFGSDQLMRLQFGFRFRHLTG